MIIFSPTEKVTKEIGGVTFICNPPVGDVEISIMQCIEGDSMSQAKELADKEIAKAGKSKMDEKKYREIVAKNLVSLNTKSRYETIRNMDRAVDVILCGWRAKEGTLPEFPKDGRPSQYLPISIKQRLFQWYQDLFVLGTEDQKN